MRQTDCQRGNSRRVWSFLFAALVFGCMAADAASGKLPESYALLARIQPPFDMMRRSLPDRYTVPVTLSGSVAVEIAAVLDSLHIRTPEYIEVLDKSADDFRLIIINKDYTVQSRDLISGILNPVEMIDVILSSFLKYREEKSLHRMSSETGIARELMVVDGAPMYHFTITPAGTRFSYAYDDAGTHVRETWLSSLTVTVDSATMTARELTMTRHARVIGADQQDKPSAAESHHRYVFAYAPVRDVVLPSRLDYYIDTVHTLTLSAEYRVVGRYILFDKRTIRYNLQGEPAPYLHMDYGAYMLNTMPTIPKTAGIGSDYTRRLRKAAVLSRKAVASLNKGRIRAAARVLRAIVEDYPGTPQAVEAGRVLSGLPRGQ